jgi:cytochrome c biogenesis protein CcdA
MTIALIVIMVIACFLFITSIYVKDKQDGHLNMLAGIFLLLLGILIKLAFSN